MRPQFESVEPGDHVATFFSEQSPQLAVSAAFIDHGIHNGEQCLYLADENEIDDVETTFRRLGIDVDGLQRSGTLRIESASDVYLADGSDPDEMLDVLTDATDHALKNDYDGFRVAGENTWSLKIEQAMEELIRFESEFDRLADVLPTLALCQYNVDRFSEETLANVLWTHEYVVYRGLLCENPYYVPAEQYLDDGFSETSVSLMLEQIRNLATSRRAIETREQRLTVINRVLRHNIRNDLNVILGNAALLRDSIDADTDRRRVDQISDTAERIVEMAEKARHVDRTLTSHPPQELDVEATVGRAVETIRAAYPSARLDAEYQSNVIGLATGDIEIAVEELLTNAIEYSTETPPRAELHVGCVPDRSVVRIDVSNRGDPIPEADREVLREGTETPLQHGSGLGLWLVKWIVDNANGTLLFPDGDDGECRVAIELPQRPA